MPPRRGCCLLEVIQEQAARAGTQVLTSSSSGSRCVTLAEPLPLSALEFLHLWNRNDKNPKSHAGSIGLKYVKGLGEFVALH